MSRTSVPAPQILNSSLPDSDVSSDKTDLFLPVEKALNSYHKSEPEPSPFANLYLFQQEKRKSHRTLRQITNRILQHAWEALCQSHPEDANFLQKRFFDSESMQVVANQLHVSSGYVYVLRKRAIRRLAVVLQTLEKKAKSLQQEVWLQRLGNPSNQQLVGVEEHLAHLLERLYADTPPWIVTLEGVGGIGKTSLADALLRRVIGACPFNDIGWVSVQTERLNSIGRLIPTENNAFDAHAIERALVTQLLPDFPIRPNTEAEQLTNVLEERLKALPHLIVIDNLETVADLTMLMPLLERLSNPTRFLLTSRTALPAMHTHYRFLVPSLAQTHAFTLIRQEAEWSNLPEVAAYTDAQLRPIYKTVGGNPLALRLCVGLAHAQSLTEIQQGFEQMPDPRIETLFRFIYQQAWESLDDLSRQIFLYMPLASSQGDTLALIEQTLSLPKPEIIAGLQTLIEMNLVNVNRSAPDYRYSIHNLTRTFLLNDAINW